MLRPLAFAWAALIWLASPALPLVRARLERSSFESMVAIGLAGFVALAVVLAVATSYETWRKRIGPLALLSGLTVLAAIALAPPDPRSRLIELTHFVEFGALGALAFLAQSGLATFHRVVRSLLVVGVVGLVDESIQHLLASRYGEIRDVLLNVAAGGLGMGYAAILWMSGEAPGVRFAGRRSWTRTLVAVMLLLLGVGFFLEAVHMAHSIRFGDVEFVSKFRDAELEAEREVRRARWRGLSPPERRALERPDQTFLVLADPYATEARFHAQVRNEAAARGDSASAAGENEILERWFDPFLDAVDARRGDLARSTPAHYRSPAMAHLWPWLTPARLVFALAGLEIALLLGILWNMRIRSTAAPLGLAVGLFGFSSTSQAFSAPMHQVDEAQMAEALDRLGDMLGLPPVSTAELKQRVETLGGLAFSSDVPVNFMSRDDLARYIRDLFDSEYTAEYAEREETMLRGFGFLTEDQDLRTLRERVLNENVAGFYDERPGVKKLFAISSGQNLNLLNQLILSHELRHALQDQHVVIREKLQVESDYDDRRLAALSLFEGDASVVMEQYLASGATRNTPELAQLFDVFSKSLSGEEIAAMFAGPALQEAPPIVQEQLIAPYFDGRRFAMAVYEKGGFPLLNAMLRKPPRSMEQVLHPEKYLSGSDEPVTVSIRIPEGTTGAPIFEGTLGEFFIRVLLRGSGRGAGDVAQSAAAGWGGDRYAVLRSGESEYRLLWRSVWDTEEDAREFATALRGYVQSRFATENNRVELSGRDVVFERRRFH
jgi:VanZ family protein